MSSHSTKSPFEKIDSEDPLGLPEEKHEVQDIQIRIKEEKMDTEDEEDPLHKATKIRSHGADNLCNPVQHPDDIYIEGTSFLHKQIAFGNSGNLSQSYLENFSVLTPVSVSPNFNQSSSNYVCHFCNQVFAHLEALNKHTEENSDCRQLYSCTICKKSCSTNCQLNSHLAMHIETGSFSCQDCGKSYTRKNSPGAHICVPIQKQPYSCNLCNAIFRSKLELSIHILKHSGDSSKIVQNEESDSEFTEVLRNVLEEHKKLSNSEVTGKDQGHSSTSIVCNEQFREKSIFDEHNSTHVKGDKFYCNKCKTLFNNATDLRKHSCEDSYPSECHLYGDTYSEKSLLTNQFKVQKNKNYWCCVCNKSFVNNSKLKSHICSNEGDSLRYLEEDCVELETGDGDPIVRDTSANISTDSAHKIVNTNCPKKSYSSKICESKLIDKQNKLIGRKLKDCASTSVLRTSIETATNGMEHIEDELIGSNKYKESLIGVQIKKCSKSSLEHINISDNLSMQECISSKSIQENPIKYSGITDICSDEKQAIITDSDENSLKPFSSVVAIAKEKPLGKCEVSESNILNPVQTNYVFPFISEETFVNKFDLHHVNKFSPINRETSKLKKNLVKHMYSLSGEQPYQCVFCEKSFVEKLSLTLHLRLHRGEGPFLCGLCKKSYSLQSEFNNHVCSLKDSQISRSYDEKFKKQLSGDSTIHTAVGIIHDTSVQIGSSGETLQEDNHTCSRPICGKIDVSRTDQNEHLINHNLFSCSRCDKLCTKEFHLFRHLASHMKNQSFTRSCKMPFAEKNSLSQHMFVHSKKHLVCKICNTGFHSRFTYLSHIRMHRNEDLKEKQNKISCNLCNRSFYGRHDYIRHSCVVNNSSHIIEQNYDDSVVSELMDKTKINSGITSVGNIGVCSSITVSQTYSMSQAAKNKLAVQNTNSEKIGFDKSINISEFSMKTKENSLLEGSVNIGSSEGKEDELHSCKICKNSFSDVGELNEHLLTHRSVSDPFSSPICEQSFVDQIYLREHLHKHSGIEKLYGKSFRDNINHKNQLEMSKHGPKFSCNVYSEAFSCKSDAETHYLTHGDSPVVYDYRILNNSHLINRTSDISLNSKYKEPSAENTAECLRHIVRDTYSQNFVSEFSSNNESNKEEAKYDENVNKTFTEMKQRNPFNSLALTGKVEQNLAEIPTNSKPPVSWNICNKNFVGRNVLAKHLVSHTLKVKPFIFTCFFCSKTFNYKVNFARHLCIHTSVQSLCSHYFKKLFIEKNTLYKHLRMYTGECSLSCHICKKSFVAFPQFKCHMKKHVLNYNEKEKANVKMLGAAADKQMQEQTNCSASVTLGLSESIEDNHVVLEKQRIEDPLPHTHFIKTEILSHEIEKFDTDSQERETEESSTDHLKQLEEVLTNDIHEEKTILDDHSEEFMTEFFKSNNNNLAGRSEISLNPFTCVVCNKLFSDRKFLTEHLMVHVSKNMPFLCPVCNKPFNRKSNLKKHLCIHTGVQPFSCPYCEKSFIEKSTLKNHISVHLEIRPFKCTICNQHFRLKSLLKSHLKRIHPGSKVEDLSGSLYETQILYSLSPENLMKQTELYTTDINLECRDELVEYQKESSCEILSQDNFEKSPEQLSSCVSLSENREKFSSADHLRNTTEELSLVSNFSDGKEMLTDPNLGENTAVFSDKTQKNVSTEEIHHPDSISAITNVTCLVCDKNFSDGNTLVGHLLTHTSEKSPFLCPLCNKPFSLKSNLKKHLCIHTGVQPFSCTYCGKSFTERSTLESHISVHFRDRPFECNICNQHFRLKSLLRCHINRIHKWSSSSGTVHYGWRKGTLSSHCSETQMDRTLTNVCSREEMPEHMEELRKEKSSNPICFVKDELLSQDNFEKCSEQLSTIITSEKGKEFSLRDLLKRRTEESSIIRNYVDEKQTTVPEFSSAGHLRTTTGELSGGKEILTDPNLEENTGAYSGKTQKNVSAEKIHLPDRNFTCYVCDKNFSDGKTLIGHLLTHTSRKNPFLCPLCNKPFSLKSNLKKHLCLHIGVLPFSCTYCGKSFVERTSLKNHISVHFADRPFECNICNQHFRLKSLLKCHINRIHRWSSSSGTVYYGWKKGTLPSPSSEMQVDGTLTNVCSEEEMLEHMEEQRKEKSSNPVCFVKEELLSQDNSEKCSEQLSTITTSELGRTDVCLKKKKELLINLEKERKEISGDLICYASDDCPFIPITEDRKEFPEADYSDVQTDELSLVRNYNDGKEILTDSHLEEIPTEFPGKIQENVLAENTGSAGEANFSCIICDKNFVDGKFLTEHLATHISKYSPFLCPICSKSFTLRSNLIRHICIHTGDQLFSCTYCEKSFIEKSALNNHILVHLEGHPFECKICKHRFRLKILLNSHIKRFHQCNLASATEERMNVNVLHEELIPSSSLEEGNMEIKVSDTSNELDAETEQQSSSETVFYKETEQNLSNVNLEEQINGLSTDECFGREQLPEQLEKQTSKIPTDNIFVKTEILSPDSSRKWTTFSDDEHSATTELLSTDNLEDQIGKSLKVEIEELSSDNLDGHPENMSLNNEIKKENILFVSPSELDTSECSHDPQNKSSTEECEFGQNSTKGKNHSSTTAKVCVICDKNFSNGIYLTEHLAVHTSRNKPFLCPICNKSFDQKSNLKRHLCIHTGVQPFSCTYCKKSFIERSTLENHVLVHLKVLPFECNICKKCFRLKTQLNFHMKIDHQLSNIMSLNYLSDEFSDISELADNHFQGSSNSREIKGKISDSTLNKISQSKENLVDNISQDQITDSLSPQHFERKIHILSKDVCFEKRKGLSGILEEQEKSSDRFEDQETEVSNSVCYTRAGIPSPDNFEKYTLLSRSMCSSEPELSNPTNSGSLNLIETEELSTNCVEEQTEELSASSAVLEEKEMSDSHGKDDIAVFSHHSPSEETISGHNIAEDENDSTSKIVFCIICKLKFSDEKLLMEHLVTHISRHSPFFCPVCNRQFSQKSNLKKHLCIHSGVHPFSCTYCKKSFTEKNTLKKHIFVHLKVRPFTCDLCKRSFRSRNQLNVHVTKIHKYNTTFLRLLDKCKGGNENLEKCVQGTSLGTGDEKIKSFELSLESQYQIKQDLSEIPLHLSNHFEKQNNGIATDTICCTKTELLPSDNLGSCRPIKELSTNECFTKIEVTSINHFKEELDASSVDNENRSNRLTMNSDFLEAKTTFSDLKVDTVTHSDDTRKEIPKLTNGFCTICDKKFADGKSLTEHLVIHHTSTDSPFVCPICNKLFGMKSSLKRHLCIHTAVQPFSCSYCGKSFIEKSTLENHVLVHLKMQPLVCKICNIFFRLKRDLNSHIKKDHKFSIVTLQSGMDEKVNNNELLQDKMQGLSSVEVDNEEISILDLSTKNSKLKGYSLKTQSPENFSPLHLEVQTDILSDNVDFETAVEFSEHLGKEKSLPCLTKTEMSQDNFKKYTEEFSSDKCSVKSDILPSNCLDDSVLNDSLKKGTEQFSSCNMEGGIEKVSENEGSNEEQVKFQETLIENKNVACSENVSCIICDEIFLDGKCLSEHLLVHISDSKPFLCPICSKSFNLKSNLKRHLCIHTGFQPFSCMYCEKSFIEKSTLKNHILVHFRVRPFICKICKKCFRLKTDLNKHIKKVHKSNIVTSLESVSDQDVAINEFFEERFQRSVLESGDEMKTHEPSMDLSIKTKENLSLSVSHGQKVDSLSLVHSEEETDFLTEDVCFEKNEELSGNLERKISEISCDPVSFMKMEMLISDNSEKCTETLLMKECFVKSEVLSVDHVERNADESTCSKEEIEQYSVDNEEGQTEELPLNSDFYKEKEVIADAYIKDNSMDENVCEISSIQTTDYSSMTDFTCIICKKTFLDGRLLIEHITTHRTRGCPYICPFCNKSFPQKSNLKRHLCIHLNVHYFSCSYCKKSFIEKKSLQNHIVSHSKYPPLKCNICNQHFYLKKLLESHLKTEHGNVNSGCSESLTVKSKTSSTYSVEELSVDHLERREENFHEEDDFTNPQLEELSLCESTKITNNFQEEEENSVNLSSEEFSVDHLENMKDKNSCKEGEKLANFHAEETLAEHVVNKQNKMSTERRNDSNNFICIICNRNFSDGNIFVTHLTTHGSKKRPFFCLYCNRSFNHKCNLKRHLCMHTGVQPFSCTYCEKKFIEKKTLDNHILIHLKLCPFECNVCHRRFRLKCLLRTHLQKYHTDNLTSTSTSNQFESEIVSKENSSSGEIKL